MGSGWWWRIASQRIQRLIFYLNLKHVVTLSELKPHLYSQLTTFWFWFKLQWVIMLQSCIILETFTSFTGSFSYSCTRLFLKQWLRGWLGVCPLNRLNPKVKINSILICSLYTVLKTKKKGQYKLTCMIKSLILGTTVLSSKDYYKKKFSATTLRPKG